MSGHVEMEHVDMGHVSMMSTCHMSGPCPGPFPGLLGPPRACKRVFGMTTASQELRHEFLVYCVVWKEGMGIRWQACDRPARVREKTRLN